MKLKRFVSGSAVILVGWLGLTFVLEVPVQRYQQRRQGVVAQDSKPPQEVPALALPEAGPEISQLSVSP